MADLLTRETVETSAWSDRELLLRTYYQAVETNGSVRRHEADLYGDPAHGVVGLKACALSNQRWIDRATTALKVLAGLVGLLGMGGIAQLVIWLIGAN